MAGIARKIEISDEDREILLKWKEPDYATEVSAQG